MVELLIEAVTLPAPVSVPSPMRLWASEAPMPTPVPFSLPKVTLPEIAATTALMADVSDAVTVSAP